MIQESTLRGELSETDIKEGGHDDGRANEKQDGTYQHHEGLDKTFLAAVELDIDAGGTIQRREGGNGIQDADSVLHHG